MSRPTKPGYYWVEHDDGTFHPVCVYEIPVVGLFVRFLQHSEDAELKKLRPDIWRGPCTRKKNKPNARVRAQRRKYAEEKHRG